MADELPIDIDYAKFLDWLVDRRRVSRGWHASLKAARVLLRSAADAMPPDSSMAAPTSYFEAVDALELLADKTKPEPFPSARATDVLGRYSHPTSRAWSSAKSSYESGCAFLAEAAQALVRNTDIEASAIRGEMARLKDTLTDCARKEGPAVRAAADAKERFHAACLEYDISSDDAGTDFEAAIRRDVEHKAPALLRRAVAGAKLPLISEALSYYCDFVDFALSDVTSEDDSDPQNEGCVKDEKVDSGLCSSLNVVITGREEELIRSVHDATATSAENTAAVDWGELDAGAEGSAFTDDKGGDVGVDWGIEIDAGGSALAAIAAERTEDVSISSSDISGRHDGGAGIDWGDLDIVGMDQPLEVEPTPKDTAFSLANEQFREAYMNDLLELRAFLKQRITELLRGSDTQISLVLQQIRNVPDSIRLVDAMSVQAMARAVDEAYDAVAGAEARHVLGLQASGEAVTRCARDLLEKMHVAIRLERNISVLAARKAQTADQLRATLPTFYALAVQTRQMKKRTEEKLQTFYRGREVNILGEINVVFPPEDLVA
jgi:hypothetical protein